MLHEALAEGEDAASTVPQSASPLSNIRAAHVNLKPSTLHGFSTCILYVYIYIYPSLSLSACCISNIYGKIHIQIHNLAIPCHDNCTTCLPVLSPGSKRRPNDRAAEVFIFGAPKIRGGAGVRWSWLVGR